MRLRLELAVVLVFLAAAALARAAQAGADLWLSGVLKDALGRPIAGAKLTVQNRAGRVVARLVSDAKGEFAVRGLKPGRYAIVARRLGFKPATALATVAPSGAPARVVLSLESEQALQVPVRASRLARAPNQLSSAGNSAYTFTSQEIEQLPQGQDTSLEGLLTQMPGVSQSVDGRIHIRGAQANFQYQIDGIILPFDSNTGFGQFLSPRFFDRVSLLTGTLPAEYGLRTSGVVDIRSKQGCSREGGNFEMYGGQRETAMPNFEYGGCRGNFSYYLTGSFLHDDLAFSQATPGPNPIHDRTTQGDLFGYASYNLSPAARLTLIAGAWADESQFPDWPGQTPAYQLAGANPANYPSQAINNTLFQQDYFAALGFQQALSRDLSYDLAGTVHYVTLSFRPDPAPDLLYQGVSSRVFHSDLAGTLQGDVSYQLNEAHSLRAGFYAGAYAVELDDSSLVFPVNSAGQPGNVPVSVLDDLNRLNWLFSVYAEDRYRLTDRLTVDYGLRWDEMVSFADAGQLSPRFNLLYQLSAATALHAGYSRFLATPQFEAITTRSAQAFAGTTQAVTVPTDFSVLAERDNYFDAGLVHRPTRWLTLEEDSYLVLARDALGGGQFGAVPIISPYNYRYGRTWGAETSAAARFGRFWADLNFSYSIAQARDLITQQYNFAPLSQLSYVAGHYIMRSQGQIYTASGQVGYRFGRYLLTADTFFGSGLWGGFANTFEFAPTWQVDVAVVRSFELPGVGEATARLMAVNVFDRVNLLQNGTGLGVFAPAYLPRRSLYGALRVPLLAGSSSSATP